MSNEKFVNELERIIVEFVNVQVGPNIASICITFGGSNIMVNRIDNKCTSDESMQEWADMALELTDELLRVKLPFYYIYSVSPNGFHLCTDMDVEEWPVCDHKFETLDNNGPYGEDTCIYCGATQAR